MISLDIFRQRRDALKFRWVTGVEIPGLGHTIKAYPPGEKADAGWLMPASGTDGEIVWHWVGWFASELEGNCWASHIDAMEAVEKALG